MANTYTALQALWPTLPSDDTNAQKLAAVNAMTVAGPMIDVPVSDVIAYLATNNGKLLALESYALTPLSGDANVTAIAAAKMFTAIAAGQMPITSFKMSQPAMATALEGMLAALVADTANTGIAAADQTAILAMAAGPTSPWCEANGFARAPVNAWDLEAAKLITAEQAESIESGGTGQ